MPENVPWPIAVPAIAARVIKTALDLGLDAAAEAASNPVLIRMTTMTIKAVPLIGEIKSADMVWLSLPV